MIVGCCMHPIGLTGFGQYPTVNNISNVLRIFTNWWVKWKKGSDEMDQPLISNPNGHRHQDYSLHASILPFLFPAMGGMLHGYDIGATSDAILSIVSSSSSGITWYNLSSVEIGLITSGSLYGALIGSVLAYNIADLIGRRRELILAAMFYLVGALVTTVSPIFSVMVAGRIIYGIGIGLALHAAPMYIAETAPTQIRGLLISMKESLLVFGLLVGYTVGSVLIEAISEWRYMYAASVPLALIMAIGMWWLPASPRWILLCAIQGKGNMQDLRDAAISCLCQLRGDLRDAAISCLCQLRGERLDSSASQQVDEILSEISRISEESEASLAEVFQGKCLKALVIGGGLVLFQQITGQPSVLYYATEIFQDAGFSSVSEATRVSILLGLLKLIMSGVSVLVVDKLGRRPLLLGGVSGIVVSLFLVGSYYTYLGNIPVVAVVALLVYVGCYQLSFGPICWLMISEIFPLRVRGRGLSVAGLLNFGANALVTFAFSPLQQLLGAETVFYMFGVIAILSLLFIFFIVPETKGLTLEEIEAKYL